MKDAKWYNCETCEAKPGSPCYWENSLYHPQYHHRRIILALADPSDAVPPLEDPPYKEEADVVIQYDDQLTDVMDKINEALVPFGLHFSDDGEDHLGCCHYRITRVR